MPFFRTKKFNKEILTLKVLKQENLLHPLLQEQIKQEIFKEIANATSSAVFQKQKHIFHWYRRKTFLRFSTATLMGFAVVGSTVFASNNTHSGDTLFSVKQVKERVELGFCTSNQSRAEMLAKHAFERIEECQALKMHKTDNNVPLNIKNQLAGFEKQAQNLAQMQVQNAILTLIEVKKDLESQGNPAAKVNIEKQIQDLREKAKEAEIFIDDSHENESEESNKELEEARIKAVKGATTENQEQRKDEKDEGEGKEEHQSEEILQKNPTSPTTPLKIED